MEFPKYVPPAVREFLEKELDINRADRDRCKDVILSAHKAGAHRRVDLEQKRLSSLSFKFKVIERISFDPRMADVYHKFQNSNNLLNTQIYVFIEKLIHACKDYKFEEDLIEYQQKMLEDISDAAKHLESLLAEIEFEYSFVKSFLELPDTLQELQLFYGWHCSLVTQRTKHVQVAKSSRKKTPIREVLRAIIFNMIRNDNIPQWTDGFFNLVAISAEIAMDQSVTTDDVRKAYFQVLRTMEKNS